MTKRNKSKFYSVIYGATLIPGLAIIFINNLSWHFLLGLLLLATIVPSLIISRIPDKKKSKKSTLSSNINKKRNGNISNSSKKKLNDKEILSTNIDDLSGIDFERLCFLYFEDIGFKPETTKVSGDHGVDLVIKDPKDGMKIAVQCKRWKKDSSVGNADLIKLFAGSRAYKCMGTLFITTSTYTNAAKDYAEAVKMETWSRLTVLDRIGKWQKEKTLKLG
jgi:restriction system protein